MEYNNIKRLLGYVRRAADQYGMINDGDRIAVGLSGGKDSLALLCVLDAMRRFYPKRYELVGITVDMGFEGADMSAAGKICEKIGIPFTAVKTRLADVIFKERKETNPCSLCARMKRGILHNAALGAGCNKVALGHHFDDAVDTFMLNLFHEGRIASFSPVTYLSRKEIVLIRPMVFVPEKDIRYFIKKNPELEVMESPCPEDKRTERETMKRMLNSLDRDYKGLKHRIFGAMQKSHIDGF